MVCSCSRKTWSYRRVIGPKRVHDKSDSAGNSERLLHVKPVEDRQAPTQPARWGHSAKRNLG